mgnify:CR=1 FL=1
MKFLSCVLSLFNEFIGPLNHGLRLALTAPLPLKPDR